MPNDIDLSNEALLARRAIAVKAMPGAFNGENDYYVREQRDGLEHRWANPPEVVIAEIDELLRLRAEVKRLNKEADWFAKEINGELCPPDPFSHIDDTYCCTIEASKRDCVSCWREAARKAVEKQCQK